ncbi:glutathione S-transferase family protein [Pseudomonas sp. NPDC089569]|uniref:glutathione S-transferase family protein n=1 Tax=Pseudomonas sp. NPDC089569 TaxID=3390722 RepID=UPI003D0672B1
MSEQIELYGAETGNSLRAAIALEEAGIAYVARKLSLKNAEHKDAAYLLLNPAGQVPTLVDHSCTPPQIICQSNAIIQYADAKAPGHLAPACGGAERTAVYERYFYFVTDVIAPSHAAFFLRGKGFDDAAAQLERRVLEQIAYSERFLTGHFMVANSFSMADISAFTLVLAMREHLNWGDLPVLLRWFDAIVSRPAVQRGLAAFADK